MYFFKELGCILNTGTQRVGRRAWKETNGAGPFPKTSGAWAVSSEKADVQKQQRRFFFYFY